MLDIWIKDTQILPRHLTLMSRYLSHVFDGTAHDL